MPSIDESEDIHELSFYTSIVLPAEQHSNIKLCFLRINHEEHEKKASTVEFLDILIMKNTFINQLEKEIHLHSSRQDISSEVDDEELVEEGH